MVAVFGNPPAAPLLLPPFPKGALGKLQQKGSFLKESVAAGD